MYISVNLSMNYMCIYIEKASEKERVHEIPKIVGTIFQNCEHGTLDLETDS